MRNRLLKSLLFVVVAAGGVVLWQRRNETPPRDPAGFGTLRPSEPFMDPVVDAGAPAIAPADTTADDATTADVTAADAAQGDAVGAVPVVDGEDTAEGDVDGAVPVLDGEDAAEGDADGAAPATDEEDAAQGDADGAEPVLDGEDAAEDDADGAAPAPDEEDPTPPEVEDSSPPAGGEAAESDTDELPTVGAVSGHAPLPQPPYRRFGTPPDGPGDDLQMISGIGPTIEETLNDEGITTFRQLAALDDAEVEALQARIGGVPGRIRREEWVEQAQDLST